MLYKTSFLMSQRNKRLFLINCSTQTVCDHLLSHCLKVIKRVEHCHYPEHRAPASVIGGLTVRRSCLSPSWANINQPSAFNQTHKKHAPLTHYSPQFSSTEGEKAAKELILCARDCSGEEIHSRCVQIAPCLIAIVVIDSFCMAGFGSFCRRWQDPLCKRAGFCIKQTNRSVVSRGRDQQKTGGIRMTPKPVRALTTGYWLINSHRCSPMPFKHFCRAFFSVHVRVSPVLLPVIMASV